MCRTIIQGVIAVVYFPIRVLLWMFMECISPCVVSQQAPPPPELLNNFQQDDNINTLRSPDPGKAHYMDVVFFHGLQLEEGRYAYFNTWKCGDRGEECWPIDWLPQDFPGARVISLNYNDYSEQPKKGKGNKKKKKRTLYSLACAILEGLRNTDIGTADIPVILVGHSFGGLVLKEVCNVAHEYASLVNAPPYYAQLLSHISTVLFYSTPHDSSNFSKLGSFAMKINPILRILEPYDPTVVAESNAKFRSLSLDLHPSWNVVQLQETRPLRAFFTNVLVVSDLSALSVFNDIRKFIRVEEADHVSICRPKARNDPAYAVFKREVNRTIYEWVPVTDNMLPTFIKEEHGHADDSMNGGKLFIAREKTTPGGGHYTPGTTGRHCRSITYELANRSCEGGPTASYDVLHTPYFHLFFEWRKMSDIEEAREWADQRTPFNAPRRRWLSSAFDVGPCDTGVYIVRCRARANLPLETDGCFGKITETSNDQPPAVKEILKAVGSFALRDGGEDGACRRCTPLQKWVVKWDELEVLCIK